MEKCTTQHPDFPVALLVIFTLAIMLCTAMEPSSALAEERAVMAHSVENGKVTNYYTTDDAIHAGYAGKTIILDVDWNFTGTMKVADSKTLTIDMNGHLITSQGNRAVIYLEENASLTLTSSTTRLFTYTGYGTYYGTQAEYQITTGGLITGGADMGYLTNTGGGIHLENNCTLTLDNVAVAGNKADKGGGLHINKNCTVHMKNNAVVEHNYAEKGGGGIWCNREDATINLYRSSIRANHSYANGGGIYSDADATRIYMIGGSTISGNEADNGGGIYFANSYVTVESTDTTGTITGNKARDLGDPAGGGGIFLAEASKLKNDEGTISGLTFSENTSAEDAGGLYISQRNITVEGCTFKNNIAESDAGGIYVSHYDSIISNCTFTGNVCHNGGSKGQGGAIFVGTGYDVTLTGKCIIEGNTREKSGSADDLYLAEWKGNIKRAYIKGGVEPGSSVGLRTEASGDTQIGKSISTYTDGAYFLDMDNFHVEYQADSTALYQRKGAASDAVSQAKVTLESYPDADTDLSLKATLSWGSDQDVEVKITWLDEAGNVAGKAKGGKSYRFQFVLSGGADGMPSFDKSITGDSISLEVPEDCINPAIEDAKVDDYGKLEVTTGLFKVGYTGSGGGDDVNGDGVTFSDDEASMVSTTVQATKALPKAGDSTLSPVGLAAAGLILLAIALLDTKRLRG